MTEEELNKYHELSSHLTIDMLRLDQDILELPQIIQDAAELAASIAGIGRDAEHYYEITRAETANKIRNADGDSPSEAYITRQLPLEQEVQDAKHIINEAARDTALVTELVRSLREKSRLLIKLSDLIIAGYITPSSVYSKEQKEARVQR